MTVRNPVVLLGAGASAEAGVPMSFDMTQRLVERLNEQKRRLGRATQAFNYVCGALIAHDASAGTNPYAGLDVERVFAAVELLSRRRRLDVTPFVSSWHPAVEEWDRPTVDAPPGSLSRTEELLQAINSEARRPLYEVLLNVLVDELVDLLRTTRKSVGYLERLVLAGANRPIAIATLNYDRSIEQATSNVGVGCSTGIEDWLRSGSWNWPAQGVSLLKLHGSIDWAWDEGGHAPGRLARREVAPVVTELGLRRDPALVFGHGSKLRAEGPFLSLLAEFERQLSLVGRLVVIGYSFRDEHINAVIRRWLAEDVGRGLTVVDPGWNQGSGNGGEISFRDELRTSLADSIGGADEVWGTRLEVLEVPASRGIAQLFPVASADARV